MPNATKNKQLIVLILITLLGLGLYYAYSEFNRVPENAANRMPDYAFTAAEFVVAYEKAETRGQQEQFSGKIIEIVGEISEVHPNGLTFDVLLETDDPMTQININLENSQSEKAKTLSPGERVTLRGFFTGKLIDMELNRGVIIEHPETSQYNSDVAGRYAKPSLTESIFCNNQAAVRRSGTLRLKTERWSDVIKLIPISYNNPNF
jgi:hypothetical protein